VRSIAIFNHELKLVATEIRHYSFMYIRSSEISIAFDLVDDIDEDDTLFVALNNHLSAKKSDLLLARHSKKNQMEIGKEDTPIDQKTPISF